MATDAIDRTDRSWRGLAASGVAVLLLYGSGARAQTVCVGDCSGDGLVRVNELVAGVNIALERAALDTCPAFDANGSDAVEVNELVTAVNHTLVGCPMITDPSPTPSNTTAPTNTATATLTATETVPAVTATATLTATTATPTGTVEESTPTATVGEATPTGTVEEATPTGTVEESTPTATVEEATPTETVAVATPTVSVTVPAGTSTPTGTVEEATATQTATATLTVTVGTATPTGTVIEGTPTHTATPLPTGTPTATGTSTSTPTATNTPDIDIVAGVSAVVGNVVTAIPNMIASIANAIQLGSDGVADGSGAGADPQSCQVTGMITVQGDLFSGLTVTLADCEVMRSGGGSTVFDGTLMVTVGLNGVGMATVDVETTFKNAMQETTLVTDADLTAAFTATLRNAQVGEPCSFDFDGDKVVGVLDMTLNGSLTSGLLGTSQVMVTFINTMADLTINTYGSDCVPSDYVMVLNGQTQMGGTGSGAAGGASGDPGISLGDVFFDDFTVNGEVTGDETKVEISGGISAICFGGGATLSTPEAVELIAGQFCPTDGTIAITDVGRIFYSSVAPLLSIDTDNDGTPDDNYSSCVDPALFMCIG